MAISDPIADLLTKVRNASAAKLERVDVPASRLKARLLEVLKREGFIRAYQPMDLGPQKALRIYLKFLPGRRPVITHVTRISKPGLRRYAGAEGVGRVVSGRGIAVLSTSRGLLTDQEARQARVGGEVLCEIW